MNLHFGAGQWEASNKMNLQMLWLVQYLVANAVAVCATGLIYPFPPLRTRKRAALAATGLFFGSVFVNVMVKSFPR